ncbi:MAG: nickel-type superoxide dismutase maturation protease [Candidatus Levybacteria bacterium]|nr:nickel-type superoxide dismutase maturation protease [Candidatus Levybacteria bacterium]MDZ4228494.1 nickel-type superoxide dismutase maturation protease [Candidatus Levybacteria bacterium]
MFPLFKFKVEGNSMIPAFKAGDTILVNRLAYFLSKPKVGNAVVLKRGKFIIKRIAKVEGNKIFVIGDNKKESTDSRNFGWINKKDIVGKVIFKI